MKKFFSSVPLTNELIVEFLTSAWCHDGGALNYAGNYFAFTGHTESPRPEEKSVLSRLPMRVAVIALGIGLSAGIVEPASGHTVVIDQSAAPTEAAAQRPPANSLHIDNRLLTRYDAKRASWTDVINSGSALPKVSATCAKEWRSSGKDARLNWKSADFLCLDSLKGRGEFRPQGIGGSSTTRHYSIGSKPAATRNLLLTTWYSKASEPGLFAPNRGGESVTRLVVLDLDKRRYRNVELVRPDGDGFRNLNSHGGGVVWSGQYIYVSSKSVLLVFNADDIVKIGGRYVLPAVARWTVEGAGGMSSMSIDRSTSPDQLKAINYTKTGPTYVADFALRGDGLLASKSTPSTRDTLLRNSWGEGQRAVHSARTTLIPGVSYQGVASDGRYCLASSSAAETAGSRGRKVDATAVFKDGALIARFQMPRLNHESIYLDYKRNLYTSITEDGRQLLYSIPLSRITKAA